MPTQPVQLTVATDCALLSDSETTGRILRVTVAASEAPQNAARLPVNLALVIDRSGSMQGEKLAYARQAASHVLTLLQERDQAAIVSFDDSVDVVSPSRRLNSENRRTMQQAIARLHSGGSTALFAGWMQGAQEATQGYLDNGVNRVLLFTDGQANHGETDPHTLANHAAALRERGLSTSTFGVGLDYNHHLLEGIAGKGGGQYHFIETPRQIPELFARELAEILTIQARSVRVSVKTAENVPMKLLGGLTHELTPGSLQIPLGDLCAGRSMEYYIELQTPAATQGQSLPLEIMVGWTQENGETTKERQTFRFHYGPHQQVEQAPFDAEIRREAAQVEIAEIEAAALKLESEGRGQEGHDTLLSGVAKHRMDIDYCLAGELTELADRIQQQAVPAAEHKSRHYETVQKRERRSK